MKKLIAIAFAVPITLLVIAAGTQQSGPVQTSRLGRQLLTNENQSAMRAALGITDTNGSSGIDATTVVAIMDTNNAASADTAAAVSSSVSNQFNVTATNAAFTTASNLLSSGDLDLNANTISTTNLLTGITNATILVTDGDGKMIAGTLPEASSGTNSSESIPGDTPYTWTWQYDTNEASGLANVTRKGFKLTGGTEGNFAILTNYLVVTNFPGIGGCLYYAHTGTLAFYLTRSNTLPITGMRVRFVTTWAGTNGVTPYFSRYINTYATKGTVANGNALPSITSTNIHFNFQSYIFGLSLSDQGLSSQYSGENSLGRVWHNARTGSTTPDYERPLFGNNIVGELGWEFLSDTTIRVYCSGQDDRVLSVAAMPSWQDMNNWWVETIGNNSSGLGVQMCIQAITVYDRKINTLPKGVFLTPYGSSINSATVASQQPDQSGDFLDDFGSQVEQKPWVDSLGQWGVSANASTNNFNYISLTNSGYGNELQFGSGPNGIMVSNETTSVWMTHTNDLPVTQAEIQVRSWNRGLSDGGSYYFGARPLILLSTNAAVGSDGNVGPLIAGSAVQVTYDSYQFQFFFYTNYPNVWATTSGGSGSYAFPQGPVFAGNAGVSTCGIRRIAPDAFQIYRDGQSFVWQCDGLTNFTGNTRTTFSKSNNKGSYTLLPTDFAVKKLRIGTRQQSAGLSADVVSYTNTFRFRGGILITNW